MKKTNHAVMMGALLLAMCLGIGEACGELFNLTSTIDGAQAYAGAGSGSPGTGMATVSYDDSTTLLGWDISWGGLLGTETAMHFHGPASPGVNAGVMVNISAISGTSSPSVGSTTISTTQAAELLNDLWYINIHTDRDPGGEIRGQVLLIPEPTSVILCLGGLVGMGFVVRRKRYAR